jgi:hypothetical protein
MLSRRSAGSTALGIGYSPSKFHREELSPFLVLCLAHKDVIMHLNKHMQASDRSELVRRFRFGARFNDVAGPKRNPELKRYFRIKPVRLGRAINPLHFFNEAFPQNRIGTALWFGVIRAVSVLQRAAVLQISVAGGSEGVAAGWNSEPSNAPRVCSRTLPRPAPNPVFLPK